jgi:hypothetical protein
MLKKIEAIRKRPIEVRKRYAFWSALAFTTVVAFFWIMSIPSRLEVLTSGPQVETQTQGGVARSFTDLRASISDGLGNLQQIKQEVIESEAVPTAAPSQNENTINFDTFFSTSTIEEAIVPTRPREVLIATSSPVKTDSTEE